MKVDRNGLLELLACNVSLFDTSPRKQQMLLTSPTAGKQLARLALVLGVAVLGLTAYAFHGVARHVPEPYMDEIFHCPQAQKYCQGRFAEWDPMITTLPGLYLASLLPVKLSSALLLSDTCSVLGLRLTNLLFALGNAILIFKSLGLVRTPGAGSKFLRVFPSSSASMESGAASVQRPAAAATLVAALETLSISLFPLVFFFNFLYYTDAGSVFFVLLCHYHAYKGQAGVSAMAGAAAVLFRQTNIVWVAFCTMVLFVNRFSQLLPSSAPGLPLSAILSKSMDVVRHRGRALVVLLVPHALVGLAFLVFLVANGGVVVGDKSSHESRLHVVQMLYFSLFVLLMSWPMLLSTGWRTARSAAKHVKSLAVLCVLFAMFSTASFLAVKYFTYAHPYLLADNRHYTFYLWRRLYMASDNAKYYFIPVYFAGFLTLWKRLDTSVTLAWKTALLLCLAATVVPAPLLEFRYFVVPFLLVRIHLKPAVWETLAEFVWFAAVDFGAHYLFFNRPFRWEHDPAHVNRFMW